VIVSVTFSPFNGDPDAAAVTAVNTTCRGRVIGKSRKMRINSLTTEAERHRSQAGTPFVPVLPFLKWCELRGISHATGRRLVREGKVKITQLSRRRIGVRADHDAEYLDACLRNGA
jgi:hypothetical protein